MKAPKQVLFVGVCIFGLLLMCGFGVSVTEGWKSPTAGDSTGGPSSVGNETKPGTTAGSKDISEDDFKGIYNGIADEDFQKIIGKLGRPARTKRSPARFACSYMSAWEKKNGTYLLLWWLESTDPRNGSKRVANFRIWCNQSNRQVNEQMMVMP